MLFKKVEELHGIEVKAKHLRPFLWLIRNQSAITLYPFAVFHRNMNPSARLVFHEEEHWREQEEFGIFKWYFSYILESIKNGYWENKHEILARQVADKLYKENGVWIDGAFYTVRDRKEINSVIGFDNITNTGARIIILKEKKDVLFLRSQDDGQTYFADRKNKDCWRY